MRNYLIATYLLLICFAIPGTVYALDCGSSASLRYQDQIFSSVRTDKDITYANVINYFGGSQSLKLDVYQPNGDTLTKRPVIVFAPGGAFIIGSKVQPPIPDYCEHFAKMGYVVVAMEYRLGFNLLIGESAERAVYRGVQDLRAALRYLAQFHQLWKIDTNNIIITGTSAGCVSGLHSIYLEPSERPSSTFGIPLENFDLGHPDSSGNNYYNNQEVPVKAMINHWGAIGDTSWINNFPRDSIPLLSMHGTADIVVPFDFGKPFLNLSIFPDLYGSASVHERLNNLGVFNQFYPLNGAPHEPELLGGGNYLDSMYIYAKPFLYEVIRPQGSAIVGYVDVCQGETTNYYTQYVPGNKYCWTLTGGGSINTIDQHTMEVSWSDTGWHKVALQELGYNLANADLRTLDVYVRQAPEPEFELDVFSLTVDIADNGSSTYNYYVDFNDGIDTTTLLSQYTYADSGMQIISITADDNYCSYTFTDTVFTWFCPEADFDYNLVDGSLILENNSGFYSSIQWLLDDSLVSQNDFLEYSFAETGDYEVTIIAVLDSLCADTFSETFSVSVPVSIAPELNSDVRLYPNPFTKDLHLEINDGSAYLLSVTDLTGKIIHWQKVSGKQRLELQHYSNGIYFFRLENEKGQKVYKLIKR